MQANVSNPLPIFHRLLALDIKSLTSEFISLLQLVIGPFLLCKDEVCQYAAKIGQCDLHFAIHWLVEFHVVTDISLTLGKSIF